MYSDSYKMVEEESKASCSDLFTTRW